MVNKLKVYGLTCHEVVKITVDKIKRLTTIAT